MYLKKVGPLTVINRVIPSYPFIFSKTLEIFASTNDQLRVHVGTGIETTWI